MKKIFKFQLKDLLLSCSIYASIMLLLTITAGCVTVAFQHEDIYITVAGNGFASAIFCLAVGIGMYKEHCQMAVMNSVSRKDFFKSLLCIAVIMSLICTLIDLLLQLLNMLPVLNPVYGSDFTNNFDILKILKTFYPGFFVNQSAAVIAAAGFLMEFLIDGILFITGVLFAGIYCRIPKKYRTAYCIALPVFGCGFLPTLFVAIIGRFFYPPFIRQLINVFRSIMGIPDSNPFLGALTFAAVSIIIASICYAMLRRTEIN